MFVYRNLNSIIILPPEVDLGRSPRRDFPVRTEIAFW